MSEQPVNPAPSPKPERMWINQPSRFDPLHSMHGTNVLAMKDTPATYQVYFLSGDVVSQQVPNLCLSRGWRTTRYVAAISKLAEAT